MDQLLASLLDLLYELRDDVPALIVGGGFGLFLKRRHLMETGARTLLTQLPEARATNDLDLFIRAEILADRKADTRKDLGQHHALDLYTIVGLMSETEHAQAVAHGRELALDPHVAIARQAVAADWASPTSLGILRLREHGLFRPEFQVEDFITVLREVFPP